MYIRIVFPVYRRIILIYYALCYSVFGIEIFGIDITYIAAIIPTIINRKYWSSNVCSINNNT